MNYSEYELQNILAPVQINSKWGFINLKGQIKIEPDLLLIKGFKNEQIFNKGVAVLKSAENGLCGVIDGAGSWLITPKFGLVTDFSEGLALIIAKVEEGNKAHINKSTSKPQILTEKVKGNNTFIDYKGNIIEFNQYDDVSVFQEGLAVAQKDNMYGYIDRNGNPLIPFNFQMASDFSEGLARVDIGTETDIKGDRISKIGFIDRKGEWIVEPQFDFALEYHNGVCIVGKNGRQGVIDNLGKVLVPFNYIFVISSNHFENGISFAFNYDEYQKGNQKIGLLSLKDKWIIEPVFDSVGEFNNGLCPAKANDKWGYIDKEGVWIIKPEYQCAEAFRNGYALVGVKDRFGYIDRLGKQITDFIFQDGGVFSYGMAAVRLDDKYGYINENGDTVISPQFEKAGIFCDINK